MNNYELWNINEEHLLFQKAIQIKILADPKALQNPKNPYRIYQYLKKILEVEQQTPLSFALPFTPLNSQQICLNLEPIRKDAVVKVLTRADLPVGIDLQTLLDLFLSIENRLNELKEEEKLKVETCIQESYELPLTELKDNLLKNHFIPNLLNLPSHPDGIIDPMSLYLCRILKAILLKSKNKKATDLLSPQEEMFLTFTRSINNCVTGQKDGIILYYNNLDPQDRINNPHINSKEANTIQNFVKSAYQSLLNHLFASETLLTNLTGKIEESQASHQTLYLKNRFHQAIGLQHNLTFDPHTGVLNDTLLSKCEMSPKEVLEEIARLIAPNLLCQWIKKEIDQLCLSHHLSYSILSTYLEQILPQKERSDLKWRMRYLDIEPDEEEYNFQFRGILEAGVWAILGEMGYIKSVAKSEKD